MRAPSARRPRGPQAPGRGDRGGQRPGGPERRLRRWRWRGATVVHEPRRGYGPRTSPDFAAADGDYIVMIDARLDRSAWALIWAARTCATDQRRRPHVPFGGTVMSADSTASFSSTRTWISIPGRAGPLRTWIRSVAPTARRARLDRAVIGPETLCGRNLDWIEALRCRRDLDRDTRAERRHRPCSLASTRSQPSASTTRSSSS